MRTARIILSSLICILFSFIVVGCDTSNKLDASVYCKPQVSYKLHGSTESQTMELVNLIDSTCEMNKYSVVQITTDKTWTYGLELETIKFNVLMSVSENVDIDVTISNLESGENYNSTQDTYFYHKSLSINKEDTTITLDINDIFINKDSVISIEVVNSCYNNTDLKLAFGNFELYGQHPEINY